MKNTPYIIKCFDLKREHGKSKKKCKKTMQGIKLQKHDRREKCLKNKFRSED